MKPKLFILIFTVSLFSNCDCQYFNEYRNSNYQSYKSEFDKRFIDHFPRYLDEDSCFLKMNIAPEINKVNLYLYEFNISSLKLDSLKKVLSNKSISKYNVSDSCLFIVNPYETPDPFDNETIFEKIDSFNNCIQNKFPIPNFIDYPSKYYDNNLILDSTFTVYVIEADKGNKFKNFLMKPYKKMPNNWQNGFSKGVAMSEINKTIIYWSIMW